MAHVMADALEAGLDDVRGSPQDNGRVELIVGRPAENARVMYSAATLDLVEGLVGDTWRVRGSTSTPDGSSNPDRQITVMNVRAATLVAVEPERRALAGDQLYVDLDLSYDNIPPGTRLALGSAVIEVTDQPHLGCKKFEARFGHDALHLVNSPAGRQLNLRGINTKVVVPGVVRVGDRVRKLSS